MEKMEANSYVFPELPKLPSLTINDQQTRPKGDSILSLWKIKLEIFEWETYITGNKEAFDR
jgi:hypothetical protein